MWLPIQNVIIPIFSTLLPYWGYDGVTGPQYWKNTFPACGGENQSPVNIITANTSGNYIWSTFGFRHYDAEPLKMTLANNGRTVHMTADYLKEATVQGEPIGGIYTFHHINFHWGRNMSVGSEHLIDGGGYSMEYHMVHYRKEYGSFEEALRHRDGLVILAVFCEVRCNHNSKLDYLIEGLRSIIEPDTKFNIKPFPLVNLLPPNTTYFYKYQGSLTTPPCNDAVTWIIFKNSLKISVDQMQMFREITKYGGSSMVDNIRHIQPLNGRTVYTGMETPHWSYADNDPGRWDRYFRLCAGLSQSPVDIMTNSTVLESTWDKFDLENYNITPSEMTLINNGHTAMITLSTDTLPTVHGGYLGTGYIFMQFHFHWGSNDSMGSEHTLDEQRFPSELHIVNYKGEYGTAQDAVNYDDGIAVLGIFLQVDHHPNPKLDSIISGLEHVKVADANRSITPFPLQNLLPGNLNEFYRYKGSLTTPTCNEVVTWTVFKQPITISEDQISKFRKLEDQSGSRILNTFRPIKPLNGRVIHYAKLD